MLPFQRQAKTNVFEFESRIQCVACNESKGYQR
jgi:hypothetical protein